MAETEKTVKPKIRYKKKVVFAGCNPEGTRYFNNIKVPIITQKNSGDFQPTIDELPPTKERLFKTKEEADKYRANHPEETKEEDDPTSVWRWTNYDKD